MVFLLAHRCGVRFLRRSVSPSAQPWRRFGSTALNEACVSSGRASESATCTFVATKVVSGMMFFFPDPWCNRRWCFFWPIGAASAFCIAIFLQSAQPWRRFGSTTLNEACVFSGRASDSAACAKVVPGIIVFFSDPSYDRLSPKENNAVGVSAAVVFLHGKKLDARGARSMDR